MIVEAKYGDNNDELDLFVNGPYAQSISLRNQILDAIESTEIVFFSSSLVELEVTYPFDEPAKTSFYGSFESDSSSFWGFSGGIDRLVNWESEGDKQFTDYELSLDIPTEFDDLFFNQTWESLLVGNDILIGGANDDSLLGFNGNDRFIPNGGDDLIVGGEGEDTVVLSTGSEFLLGSSATFVKDTNHPTDLFGEATTTLTGRAVTTGESSHFLVDVERIEIGSEVYAVDLVAGTYELLIDTENEPPEPVTTGNYNLDIIIDFFGHTAFVEGITETIDNDVHRLTHEGKDYNYEEVESFIMVVVRDNEFTSEFSSEIADLYPSVGDISYEDALAIIGVPNWATTVLNVAGADGDFVG